MLSANAELSRRQLLVDALGGLGASAGAAAPPERRALIAITLDLEMCRNFPTWEQTHWDYEKGNLDGPTKRYTVDACRRVRARGGVIHCFAVGRVLEQENIDWLKEIAAAGHPVGNHTYDHVNVKATRPQDLQYRFQRAPWLIHGRTPREVITENIRMTTMALKERAGIENVGFRTPGGFADGIADRPDLQALLTDCGFRWTSSKYPSHPMTRAGTKPTDAVLAGIVEAQRDAQPFGYPSGLVEIPMSPPSDITAFRTGRWQLDDFLEAVRRAVIWAIANGAVFDFLAHPSCLVAIDPNFRAIDMICDLVHSSNGKARLVSLETIFRELGPTLNPRR
jgi:peptidoglycan/xylan/chitin deacetylase (PgdA/CDA1 family)